MKTWESEGKTVQLLIFALSGLRGSRRALQDL